MAFLQVFIDGEIQNEARVEDYDYELFVYEKDIA